MTELEYVLEETRLSYINDSRPGISRVANGKSYFFRDKNGQAVTNEKALDRIKKLAIPSAWTKEWIAPTASAHLQATGINQAGRKQYRYHNEWTKQRNETKYYRLLEFGSKLPEFRKNIQRDLRRKELDERKVLAISVFDFPESESQRKKNIVSVLDRVAAKLGNTRAICKKSYVFPAILEEYESGALNSYLRKLNRSPGLTSEKGLSHDEKILLSFLRAQRKKRENV